MSKKGRIRRENAELKALVAKLQPSQPAPAIPKTRRTGKKRLQMQKLPAQQDLMGMVKRLEKKNADLLKEAAELRQQVINLQIAYGKLQNRKAPAAARTPLGIHLPAS